MLGVVIHGPHDLRINTLSEVTLAEHEVAVRIGVGGICGSDLHYYHQGGFGAIRVREPMALGHEISGTIEAIGSAVSHMAPGLRVAVNPSRPCNRCRFCREGQQRHCSDMRFMGSAMRTPHVQGGFRELVCVDASQAVPVPDALSLGEAAMAEPLSVCLHAARQAGTLLGKRILITGSGPIGVLALLVSRMSGAAEIVITDIADAPLALAKRLGADRALNVASEAQGLERWKADKGQFDILFEASGNQSALVGAFDVIRPGGIVVQLGLGGDMTLPMNIVVAKELQIRGTFRFDQEFELAVRLMGDRRIDVKPLISATLPFRRAVEAFDLASDRSKSMKVQLAF